jgi:hypothetical protein
MAIIETLANADPVGVFETSHIGVRDGYAVSEGLEGSHDYCGEKSYSEGERCQS